MIFKVIRVFQNLSVRPTARKLTDKTEMMIISTQQERQCFGNDQMSLLYKDVKLGQSSCEILQ